MNFELEREYNTKFVAGLDEKIKNIDKTLETIFNVEDVIGLEKCSYADFSEFVIKTHNNGGKAMQD